MLYYREVLFRFKYLGFVCMCLGGSALGHGKHKPKAPQPVETTQTSQLDLDFFDRIKFPDPSVPELVPRHRHPNDSNEGATRTREQSPIYQGN